VSCAIGVCGPERYVSRRTSHEQDPGNRQHLSGTRWNRRC
jgi:hypothetical protein